MFGALPADLYSYDDPMEYPRNRSRDAKEKEIYLREREARLLGSATPKYVRCMPVIVVYPRLLDGVLRSHDLFGVRGVCML